ncbi:MAG: N-acetyltransferase [Acidobacteriia bacterium]|nr:N-acetyltransferase [Terriglobia bacterium]
MSEVQVVNNETAHRFEAGAAFLSYHVKPGEITLIHTEVPAEMEGRGIGGKLARAALDYARTAHMRVVAMCPFVSEYVKRHPEYEDLIRK